jgi:predicted PurR-regulated permease PerM
MAEHDVTTSSDAPERPKPPVKHLATAGPGAKKVAGVRRNPSVVGYEDTAPHWLRVVAGWSWRTLVVTAAVAVVFWATSQVQFVFIAVFIALVFTAVLRPLVKTLSRIMPRGLATAVSMILALLGVAGVFTYVGLSVAGQWENLAEQFNDGIATIFQFLEDSPLHLRVTTEDVEQWLENGQRWLEENSSEVAGRVASSAGSVALVFSALALATFCTVFFLTRGEDMWHWFLNQLPLRVRETWLAGGDVAWYTFSGYTRGTVIVAAADGVMALIILLLLGVPLAAPLAVLVFIGAFIPLIGAPLAMVVAMIVALATNGVVNAILVGVGIALIGQFEGHVLTPLVMGKQVSLHPVAVALSVTAGTIVAGILGAVIAVPLVAVAWAVFSRLRHADPPTDFDEPTDSDEVEDDDGAPPAEVVSDGPARTTPG